jgi:hypothetical protein
MTAERKFSPRCTNCRQRKMSLETIPYDIQIDHDGRKCLVHIPALRPDQERYWGVMPFRVSSQARNLFELESAA